MLNWLDDIFARWERKKDRLDRERTEAFIKEMEYGELAAYNARRSQGVVHTAEYVLRMQRLQEEWAEDQKKERLQ
jgi:hypothetical protein